MDAAANRLLSATSRRVWFRRLALTSPWCAREPGPWLVERVPEGRGPTATRPASAACAPSAVASWEGLALSEAGAASVAVAESHITGAGELTSTSPCASVTVRFPPASVAAVAPLPVSTVWTRSWSAGPDAAVASLTTSVSSAPPAEVAVTCRSTPDNTSG